MTAIHFANHPSSTWLTHLEDRLKNLAQKVAYLESVTPENHPHSIHHINHLRVKTTSFRQFNLLQQKLLGIESTAIKTSLLLALTRLQPQKDLSQTKLAVAESPSSRFTTDDSQANLASICGKSGYSKQLQILSQSFATQPVKLNQILHTLILAKVNTNDFLDACETLTYLTSPVDQSEALVMLTQAFFDVEQHLPVGAPVEAIIDALTSLGSVVSTRLPQY